MSASELASYQFDAANRITAITQQLWAASVPVTTITYATVVQTATIVVTTTTVITLPSGLTASATTTATSTVSTPMTVSTSQVLTPSRLYPVPLVWTVGYDSRGRVTRFARPGAASQYSYDANGNRQSAAEQTTSDTDLDGDFDAMDATKTVLRTMRLGAPDNRLAGFDQTLTSVRGTRTLSTSHTGVGFTLDPAGQHTSDGLREFEYDASGRLSKVRIDLASQIYKTNALGQRVFKSEPQADLTGTGSTPGSTTNTTAITPAFTAWLKKNFGWMYDSAQSDASLGTAYVYAEDNAQGPLPAWALLGEYDNGSAASKGRTEYIWLPIEAGEPGGGKEAAHQAPFLWASSETDACSICTPITSARRA